MLCVWFPHWPLQRLLLERPELRNRPVVIAGRGQRGREVRFASRPARDLGVAVGQPLAEAEALLEPPPGTRSTGGPATILAEDRAGDRLALEQRALWCQRYSPLVGLAAGPAPEALLVSLDGCAHLLGGEEPLARQLLQDLERGGHHVRLAVAPTIAAAWGLARHFARPHEELLITPAGVPATDPACRSPRPPLRMPNCTASRTFRSWKGPPIPMNWSPGVSNWGWPPWRSPIGTPSRGWSGCMPPPSPPG